MGNLRGDETPMETGELTKEHLVVAEEEQQQVCLVVLGRKGGDVIEREEKERFMVLFFDKWSLDDGFG